jgi:hypothetical protein
MAQNININKTLDSFQVPRNVYAAIQNAAKTTGVNFTYLLEKAAVESGFDPDAKARTSSATGLFQFIESTWLHMVKRHGDKHGLSEHAAKITDDGRVTSAKARKEILALRKDPEIAALMAAEFDRDNYDQLKENVGGNIGATELYMAHFLGAGGAGAFLNAMKKSPNMIAADLFPREARANRGVFYDSKTGAPRSMKQVYAFFDKKFDTISPANDQSMMTAAVESPLRVPAAPKSAATYAMENDPFERLANLMSVSSGLGTGTSLLRLSEANQAQDWQIFPPSHYNRLSLSAAQMQLLSDFSA